MSVGRRGQRGQLSIDRIVAVRSSVLPLYVIIQPSGTVTTSDEVSEDGCDFLTTRMHGEAISFCSIRGDYLSSEGGHITTRRYCGACERFLVERLGTQYAFKAANGNYLSILERAPFVSLSETAGETETFQLFSLMMDGINVGQQLETLERTGHVFVGDVIDEEALAKLRLAVIDSGGGTRESEAHEIRVANLSRAPGFAKLATHPIVLQLARRCLSPLLRLSDVESCCTDADFVRKEVQETTWHVVHPYCTAEFPGLLDERASLTAMWFLDALNEANSTWSWVQPPLLEGTHLPRLPHLCPPDELEAIVKAARPLHARAGSLWLYLGPMWLSNTAGAGSFWRDHDAQARYKHLSGQMETYRAMADAQRSQQQREELCPLLLQATYVREYIAPRFASPLEGELPSFGNSGDQEQLLRMLAPRQP